jgi:arylsulfatase A-like enzyme
MERNPLSTTISMALTAAVCAASATASAAQITGTPGSPGAATTVDGRYLPNQPAPFGGEIGLSAKDSKPYWRPTVVPPKGAPNVLLIMTDDAGYGVSSTFGGVIPTPNLDRIAKMGLRYTQFHSTALSSPTRAALITGRNHHSVGFGVVAEQATGFPGYDAALGVDNGTIGEILKQNGYATSWFGKNHNTPSYQYSLAGPFDQWPVGMGFEYFYGFMGGEADQHSPFLFRNTSQIFPWNEHPDFNLVTGMADDAIQYLKQLNAAAPDKPFFCYYVPGATHAPHHPTKEWIDKFKGRFDKGWNVMREEIFANQKRLGVIPANTRLTPWPDELKKWDDLTADEKRLFARQAEVFAAYVAYTDNEIGRVIQAVQDMGKLDNTLVIYIEGDNGTSSEGSLNGTPFDLITLQGMNMPVAEQLKYYDVWGSAETQPHMAVGWAWAFDSPFQWVKQVASHFGGTRQGMAVAWPNRIKDAGGIRTQFHHMIDIVPTILEAVGVPAPQMLNGVAQKPIEGVSMAYTWDKVNAMAPSTRRTQYFEIFGNRAVYHDGWMASTTPPEPPWLMGTKEMPEVVNGYKWELYNINEDFSQSNNLAAKMPAKLHEMQELFLMEATRYNVLPLDNSILPRVLSPKPSYVAGRDVFVYSGELSGLATSNAPDILAKSFTMTAEVEVPQDGGNGMIVTEGGKFGGYGFYVLKGKPVFTYNFFNIARFRWEGASALAPGKHTLVFDFKYDGPGLGKGGTGVLKVDGREVASRQIPHTMPVIMTFDETFDVGVDTRTGVDDKDYQVPFRFNGKIDKLTVQLGK